MLTGYSHKRTPSGIWLRGCYAGGQLLTAELVWMLLCLLFSNLHTVARRVLLGPSSSAAGSAFLSWNAVLDGPSVELEGPRRFTKTIGVAWC